MRSAQVKYEIKSTRSTEFSALYYDVHARFTAQLRKQPYYENSLVPFYDEIYGRKMSARAMCFLSHST